MGTSASPIAVSSVSFIPTDSYSSRNNNTATQEEFEIVLDSVLKKFISVNPSSTQFTLIKQKLLDVIIKGKSIFFILE